MALRFLNSLHPTTMKTTKWSIGCIAVPNPAIVLGVRSRSAEGARTIKEAARWIHAVSRGARPGGPSRKDRPEAFRPSEPAARSTYMLGAEAEADEAGGSRRSNGIHPKSRTAKGGDIFAVLASTRPITRFCRIT